MPIFRCDYRVEGDLVLPSMERVVRLQVGSEPTFTIRNELPDEEGHSRALIVSAVGESTDLRSAEGDLRKSLAKYLSLLAFVLQSRFKIDRPVRCIEWTPFARIRRMLHFHTVDPRSPPSPELTPEHFATAAEIARSMPSDALMRAMHFFRYGMFSRVVEDQFFNLWLALEIVAENAPKTPIAVTCKCCKGPIVCKACGTDAVRMPFGRHAIEQLMRQHADTADIDEQVTRLFDARNKLLHGSSLESITKQCGRPLPDLVNELGMLTWRAVLAGVKFRSDGGDLSFGHWGGAFASMVTIGAMEIQFRHDGPEEHPPDSQIPTVTISLKTRFGGKSADELGSRG